MFHSLTRRSFLTRSTYGLGGLALAHLMGDRAFADVPRSLAIITPPHYPIKARRVIHLCMAGGPSQFETFDWKPVLKELHHQPFPPSLTKGQQLTQLQNTKLLARGSFARFKKWGRSGQEISELLPHAGSIADDICIVRSMV